MQTKSNLWIGSIIWGYIVATIFIVTMLIILSWAYFIGLEAAVIFWTDNQWILFILSTLLILVGTLIGVWRALRKTGIDPANFSKINWIVLFIDGFFRTMYVILYAIAGQLALALGMLIWGLLNLLIIFLSIRFWLRKLTHA